MAIKINWQDLLKRYINWQEIVRVYKNGGQIRPETVPPVWWDYLCFTAEESNSSVGLKRNSISTDLRLEISYDKSSWTDYTIWNTITLANVWDKVYMRNKSETQTVFSINQSLYYSFTMTWKIWASGDVNYLLCKNSTTSVGCFYGLFMWCSSLTRSPELPATTLAESCYSHMFDGCSSLATAPQLPATEVGSNSYEYMFSWCTSLTTAPELPATTLANRCYENMFLGCTSLTTAPELPATTLMSNCYNSMFSWCTSLTTIPQLPATTVVNRCYESMFSWCTSLTTIPQLPATTMTFGCYQLMFQSCTSIKISETQTWEYQTPYRIPSSWTWTDYPYSTQWMLLGTWWTFTGTPSINTTYYTSNQVI